MGDLVAGGWRFSSSGGGHRPQSRERLAGAARAMAQGVRERLGVDVGISTTGIAGPDGGTPEKPVGLVWFGFAFANGEVHAQSLTIPGSRDDIRGRSTTMALGMLWRHLERLRGAETPA